MKLTTLEGHLQFLYYNLEKWRNSNDGHQERNC
jgi:hypothetical protein